MAIDNSEVLVESASARNLQMERVGSDDSARDILLQINHIVFLAAENIQTAIPKDVAEFYNSSEDYIRSVVDRHRDEFEIDGLRQATKQELKALKAIGRITKILPKSVTRLTLWTPRSVLRLGMLLTKSEIAKEVRNILIEIAANSGAIQEPSNERNLQLELELQKAKQYYQDTGWEIVQKTSPAMLAFIRGEAPLIRYETQYIEQETGKLAGSTAKYRILPQLVEDLGLERNSQEDQDRVRDILESSLDVNFETGEGLGQAFDTFRPIVIPEDQYPEFLQLAAEKLYGRKRLQQWSASQQSLPDYLEYGPVKPLPPADE